MRADITFYDLLLVLGPYLAISLGGIGYVMWKRYRERANEKKPFSFKALLVRQF